MLKLNISLMLFLVSSVALGSAYISQYGFGYEPCIFCLYQRIPYFVVIGLSLVSLFLKGRAKLFCILLCAGAFAVGAGLAFYHVGIEQGVFALSSGCEVGSEIPSTIEEMTAQLMGKPNVPCDKAQFVFLGISMAGWNFLFSSALCVITFVIIARIWRNQFGR